MLQTSPVQRVGLMHLHRLLKPWVCQLQQPLLLALQPLMHKKRFLLHQVLQALSLLS
jgi:hypothetical protein